jgi:outer membrane protein TolC
MPSHRLWLLILCACAATAHANDAPLSLDAAVQRALEIAPQVGAASANVEAMRALTLSAGRLPDPELVVGVDNLPINGPDAYSTADDFMTMRKIGVMQEFPSASKRRLQRERAQADSRKADAELVADRLLIAQQVAQAWIRRATAEAALRELHALQPEVELQASAARAAVSSGRSSTAEALSAESAVARLRNRSLQLQTEALRATAELSRWLDQDAATSLAPVPSFDELPTPPDLLLEAVHEHGSLLPFESQIEAARIDVDLAKAERTADWSAELVFAKRGPDFSDMVSLQVRVGLPLFTRNRQDPVISARHAQLRRIEADREAELRMHTAEVKQRITEWEQAGRQLQQYEHELLPLARERSRASLASYRAGRADLRMALDAYAQEIELVVEHAQLQNERGQAWAFLRYLGPEPLHQEQATP